MGIREQVEVNLDFIFVKRLPPLSAAARKAIVDFLPFVSAALGLLTLALAYGLYHAAYAVAHIVNYAHTVGAAYGTTAGAAIHVPVMVWVAIAVLAIEAVLFLAAFPAVQARRKSGWDLLFYALLINAMYGVASVFTNYSGVGRLFSSLLGSVAGLYVLFQIRGSYSSS